MQDKILSANQANRLFWLGRYAERGYLMLHLMRRAYDEVIDVPVGEKPYSDFLSKLDVYMSSEFTTSYQMMQQIYDPETVTSLRTIIERMMDNAIVLRSEIYSESFSYIELCRDFIRSKSDEQDTNITNLQPITDYLLAFWGSTRERIYGRVHTILEIGKLVEHLDMNIRFDYKFYRIEEAWEELKKFLANDESLYDEVQLKRFETLINDKDGYDNNRAEHKAQVLHALNSLIRI